MKVEMPKPTIIYYSILKYQQKNLQLLNEKFDVVELHDPSEDTDEILADAAVILAPLGYKVDQEKIDRCKSLIAIGSNTTGHPHIDVEYAKSKGVAVVTLKYEKEFLRKITPTAELTLGLIIALTRQIIPAVNYVAEGKWDRRPFGGDKMLSRMKLGVIGLGRLGYKVGQYALRIGMEVCYYDPYVTSGYPGFEKRSKIEDVVSDCDVITVHVPHERETENMFDASLFDRFKQGSYFINTSRGELVDHDALLKSLESGKLAGTALDVFEGEFEPEFEKSFSSHPLWKYAHENSNVIITPHIAGSTYDAWADTEKHTIDNILETVEGTSPVVEQLEVNQGEAWALIPARGGSKTIPLKNLVKLNGKPLVDYAVAAGLSNESISRVICSTDSDQINEHCKLLGIDIQDRPEELGRDNTTTVDVMLDFVLRTSEIEMLPEYLVLLEPTSPFVTNDDIQKCIDALNEDQDADSAQTVTQVSSNSHAYNQRFHDSNGSNFLYVDEREICVNKQLKPQFFIHGNVRVMRVKSLVRTKSLFGEKSLPIIIPRLRAMDVDGPDDLVLAETIISAGLL